MPTFCVRLVERVVVNLEGLGPRLLAMTLAFDGMSNVKHRLAYGTEEKLQVASLIGVAIDAGHSIR